MGEAIDIKTRRRIVDESPEGFKTCRDCLEVKPHSEFGRNARCSDGLAVYCKPCKSERVNKRQKQDRKDWRKRLLQNIRSAYADKRRKKVFSWKKSDITIEFLQGLYEKQEGLCYWFGIPLETELDGGLRQISLDRLDCSSGYTQDNVVLTCRSANFARNDEDPTVFNKFISLLRAGLEGRD